MHQCQLEVKRIYHPQFSKTLFLQDDFGMLMLHSRLTEIGDAIMKENAKLDKINESRNDIEKTIASLKVNLSLKSVKKSIFFFFFQKREPTPSNEVAIKNLEDIIINLNMDANPITEEIDALKKRYKEVNKVRGKAESPAQIYLYNLCFRT